MEELKLGRDIVSVVQTVRVFALNIDSVTLNPAMSKVKNHIDMVVEASALDELRLVSVFACI